MMQYTKKKRGKKSVITCPVLVYIFFFNIKPTSVIKKVSHIFNMILGLVYVENFQTSLYCSTKAC